MRNITAAMLIAATALGMHAEPEAPDTVAGFVFTDVKLVPTTSVKDQNRSGTCWSFSSASFLEEELLRKTGKEHNLSEMYVVRHCYRDKADRYVRMYGETGFAGGGSNLDIFYVMDRYGLVPEEAYPGIQYGEEKHDHSEMDAGLQAYVKAVTRRPGKRLTTAWGNAVDGILDAYLGAEPETFQYEGVTYTPRTYADALGLSADDYVAVTSYTHHPFYKPFVLEVADNWLFAPYENVPMEEMKAIVDNALDNGYSVAWAADVSEPGFKWRDGYAVIPRGKDDGDMTGTELARWVKLDDREREAERYKVKGPTPEVTVTQEMRQEQFDRQETTDDHGMVIIGYATDQEGNRYYKVKNSWDTNQVYDGYFYVSEPYFLAKTLNIVVNREALPKDIAKKLKR